MQRTDFIRDVICSVDGGFNGLNLGWQLDIKPQDDGTIRYSLVDRSGIEPDQVFIVTIEEATT